MSPHKTVPRLPRGLIDRTASDLAATEKMLAKIRAVYTLYGFEALETPFFEYTDALGKFLPDQDRPNEGVFSFQDDDEQWLSLRYDLTAPLARYVAQHFETLPKPYRSMRAGWVFRNEKPGPGRFRQFMQCDADIVGAAGPAADAELCMMMADTLEALGLKRGQYVIKVNNRKILDGVMEAIGLGGEEKAGQRLTVLRAIDKLDRLGIEGVKLLLGAGRKDESGDFTKGAGLDEEQIDKITVLISPTLCFASAEHSDESKDKFRQFNAGADEPFAYSQSGNISNLRHSIGSSPKIEESLNEIDEINSLIAAAGYHDGRIIIETSVVRGLEYYTSTVFEAELLLPVTGEDGQPMRFGSIGGGGRYDELIGRFRSEPVPATGFSIGVSRLLAALKAVDSPLLKEEAAAPPLVVVTVMDRARIGDYQAFAHTLRQAGLPAEVYLGEFGFKAQMKYADRRKAAIAIIQGSDEQARGEVQIKDLILGAEIAGSGKDRADYLDKQQEAQRAVPVGTLVEAVKRVLTRHGYN